ncbi:MAG: hypothetical protein PHD67_03960 [Oscillospiraceae bacterium]|nr:hypothetical protein [Oscillospiraceae bacterium]
MNMNTTSQSISVIHPAAFILRIERRDNQALVHYLPGGTSFLMPECCRAFIQPITLQWMDDYLPSKDGAPYPVLINSDGRMYDRAHG